MFFPARLALSAALVLSASHLCHADPAPLPPVPVQELPATPVPSIQIEAVTPNKELRLDVQITHGELVAALSEIALKGNLQVAVKPGVSGNIEALNLKGSTPEAALQKVCTSAGLSYELKDDIWFVSPAQAAGTVPEKTKLMDSMAFTNVEVTTLLELLANQFDLPIAVAADVKGEIPFLRLQNKTPRQALNLIGLVADLQIEEKEDGTFIVSLKQP